MCTEGFTYLLESARKPLSIEDHPRLKKASPVENIIIDVKRRVEGAAEELIDENGYKRSYLIPQ
jgi:hypothetical protein